MSFTGRFAVAGGDGGRRELDLSGGVVLSMAMVAVDANVDIGSSSWFITDLVATCWITPTNVVVDC